LGPYLDSESDAKTTQEIELHLANCMGCAERFAAEERLNERMFAVLRQGTRTSSVWQPIEARIVMSQRKRWPPWLTWRRLTLAVVAATVCQSAAWWTMPRTLDLAEAAVKRHEAYVDDIVTPEFTGAVPVSVASALEKPLDVTALAYQPSEPLYASNGARRCHISGAPIAWTLARYGDTRVSVMVFKKDDLARFPSALDRLDRGESVVCCTAGAYEFAVRVVGDHVVCMVGSIPMTDLDRMIRSVTKRM
jgi:anti-sigma factor RsiW